MPKKAKLYVACTAVAGLVVLEMAIHQWTSPNLPRFLAFLLLGLVASTLKVRLPRVTSTVSASFLFVLIGVAEFSFSETVAMAGAVALIQSVWRAKQRPKLVQLVFNVSSWAISGGISYQLSHLVLAAARVNFLPVLIVLAASLFFVTHMGMLATVLSLTAERPLKAVWRQCYSWSFPYYIAGTAIAGLVSASSRSAGWPASLLVLPMMYLIYLCYRFYVEPGTQEHEL